MDFSTALPTFVITLREGVEAALVVGIVLACLKQAKQNQLNSWVFAGVGVGIVVSALVGAVFIWIMQILGAANPMYTPLVKPLLEGVFSVVAIAMLSWMLIWMTQQAQFIKAELAGSVTAALSHNTNAGRAIFSLIFIAVVREGFETVLFIAANFQQGLVPVLGAILGLAIAAAIGILLFKLGVKINIRLFFKVMGILLLLIVAGLVISALKHFDAAVASLAEIHPQWQVLCFSHAALSQDTSCILGARVWDASNTLPDTKFPGIIFKALFGYRQKLYFVQAIAYLAFLFTVGSIYFRSLSSKVSTQSRNRTTSSVS